MGLLSRLYERRASPENPSTPLSNPADWLVDLFGGGPTTSGESVSESTALRLAAVWACVRVRAESFACLPVKVYRRRSDTARDEQRDHPLAVAVREAPNVDGSAMVWRETQQANVDLGGNCYARIVRKGSEVVALETLHPHAVNTVRRGDRVWHLWNPDPTNIEPQALAGADVLHVRGMSRDGLVGQSQIATHRETIGYGIAVRKFGSRFFGNAAKASGFVTLPTKLDDPVANEIAARLRTKFGGENAHSVAVLGSGADWKPVSISPEDSQYIETFTHTIREVCMIFRCPPHKIGFLVDAGDRGNVEQENLSFSVDVLSGIAARWEGEFNRKGFTDAERRAGFYVKVDLNAQLRGDFATRTNGYKTLREIGVLSADEIRALEDLNPIGGRAGETYLVPLNMTDAAEEPAPEPEPAPPAPAGEPAPAPPDPARAVAALEPLLAAAYVRALRRLRERVESAARAEFRRSRSIDADTLISLGLAAADPAELAPYFEPLMRSACDLLQPEDVEPGELAHAAAVALVRESARALERLRDPGRTGESALRGLLAEFDRLNRMAMERARADLEALAPGGN